MALARARRSESGMNYWPGFVDALSTLILGIIFLLTVFVVVQFYLQQEVQGKDTALHRLDEQVAKLSDLLSMEKTDKTNLEKQLGDLRASLATTASERDKYKSLSDSATAGLAAAESERDKYKSLSDSANASLSAAQGKIDDLTGSVQAEKKTSAAALAQVETLNQQIAALRQQIATVEAALDISNKKGQEAQARITDLGAQLNVALAQRAKELSNYRSEFFGKLRDILGNRPDIRIVGDRFVLQSEIFFDTGRADLKPEGRAELDQVAAAVVGLESQIPPEIAWVLRVDGHTDVRPVTGGLFKSNWDLSSARAIAVVNYLIQKGVKPIHLVAAAFGEYQPIDTGNTEDAYRRNRRIEFKLTDR